MAGLISDECRDQIRAAGMHLFALRGGDGVLDDYTGEAFVLLEHQRVRWWSVADVNGGIISGPWQYFGELVRAKVIGWMPAPDADQEAAALEQLPS